MELGIIGLPTSGKTTIFNALTHSDRPTAVAYAAVFFAAAVVRFGRKDITS